MSNWAAVTRDADSLEQARKAFQQHNNDSSSLDVLERCKRLNEFLTQDFLRKPGQGPNSKAELQQILALLSSGPKRPSFLDKPPITHTVGKGLPAKPGPPQHASLNPPGAVSLQDFDADRLLGALDMQDEGSQGASSSGRTATPPSSNNSSSCPNPVPGGSSPEDVDDLIGLLNIDAQPCQQRARQESRRLSDSGRQQVLQEQERSAEEQRERGLRQHGELQHQKLQQQKQQQEEAEQQQRQQQQEEEQQRQRQVQQQEEEAQQQRREEERRREVQLQLEKEQRQRVERQQEEERRKREEAQRQQELKQRQEEEQQRLKQEAKERRRQEQQQAEERQHQERQRAEERQRQERQRAEERQRQEQQQQQAEERRRQEQQQQAEERRRQEQQQAEERRRQEQLQAEERQRQEQLQQQRLAAALQLQAAVRALLARRTCARLRTLHTIRCSLAARSIQAAWRAWASLPENVWKLGPVRAASAAHNHRSPRPISAVPDGLLAQPVRLRAPGDTRSAPQHESDSRRDVHSGRHTHRTVSGVHARTSSVRREEAQQRGDVATRAVMAASKHRDTAAAIEAARRGSLKS